MLEGDEVGVGSVDRERCWGSGMTISGKSVGMCVGCVGKEGVGEWSVSGFVRCGCSRRGGVE